MRLNGKHVDHTKTPAQWRKARNIKRGKIRTGHSKTGVPDIMPVFDRIKLSFHNFTRSVFSRGVR
jgi:hypothetical protein